MSKFMQEVSALPKNVQAMFNAPTEAPDFKNLQEGDHVCKFTHLQMVNSRENTNGTLKANQPAYVDSFPQIFFRALSVDGKGSVVGRINLGAFGKYEDLTDAEKESGKFENHKGYACHLDKDKNLVRIPSAKGLEGVKSINNSIAHAIGQTGQDIAVALDNVMEAGDTFGIKVVIEEYDGKEHANVEQWFPASAQVNIEATPAEMSELGD